MWISSRQQKIILLLIEKGTAQSSRIHAEITKRGESISLVTIKRELAELANKGVIVARGGGRSTAYAVTTPGRIFADINAREYCAVEPDKRYGMNSYNFDLFPKMPLDVFSDTEQKMLESATMEYAQRTEHLPPAIQKELERLIIELSWKSPHRRKRTLSLIRKTYHREPKRRGMTAEAHDHKSQKCFYCS